MENNNWKWYEDSVSGGGAMSADCGAPGQPKRKEPKKRFGWAQLIAGMLVVGLLAGAAGAGVTLLAQNYPGQQLEAAGDGPSGKAGGVVIDEDAIGAPDQTGGAKASEGITLGSAWADEDTVAEMLQKCMSSVVGIDIVGTASGNAYWNDSGESDPATLGSGSGVILTGDGYIVTCNHVVAEAAGEGVAIKVYLQDGTAYDAVIVGRDGLSDLAVIKIEAENLPAAAVGNSSQSVVGDTVYAIGNPLGALASSVTDGIVSGLDRLITIDGADMTLMQTNAAVNPGNSGGGLFNSAGELIGVVNSKATGENVEGIGFAIPIDSALPIIKDLMDLGYVSGRPYLGITPVDVYLRGGSPDSFGFPAYTTRAQVYAVESGSAADRAGMKAGDVILALDGKDVYGASDLMATLYEYKIGDTVTITVLRDREQVDLTATLGERAG
ncbi:MAG: Serine protease Do-like HtrB [Firmicutes bacterium ADurb.Bin248]|nr:MAG: Serine protease Do-like HtrB [Firmicutes bacterium ADurb.Bin248]HOF99473.1 trypsin-like peptidase domain-containing protein [Clostridia bacterium]